MILMISLMISLGLARVRLGTRRRTRRDTLLQTSYMRQTLLATIEIYMDINLCMVKVSCMRQHCKRDCLSALLVVSPRVISVSLKCDFQLGLAQIRSLSDMRQGE